MTGPQQGGPRQSGPHQGGRLLAAGPPPGEAARAMVLLHGRAAPAEDILGLPSAACW